MADETIVRICVAEIYLLPLPMSIHIHNKATEECRKC